MDCIESKRNHVIEECGFCGNNTKLDIVANHWESEDLIYYDEGQNEEVEEWISDKNWMILKCCVCGNISIGTDYVDQNMAQNDQSYFSILFPQKIYSFYHMPKEIYKAYEVAIKSRHLDSSLCLLSLRRTLEIICKQQGETSGNLVKKVEKLATRGILPNVLKDASNIVRVLGNAAAHGDNVEFSKQDVNDMIKFVEMIIEYIYILPEKIQRLNQ